MVYNKDPIDKEKAIEKTYVHLQGLKKNCYDNAFRWMLWDPTDEKTALV